MAEKRGIGIMAILLVIGVVVIALFLFMRRAKAQNGIIPSEDPQTGCDAGTQEFMLVTPDPGFPNQSRIDFYDQVLGADSFGVVTNADFEVSMNLLKNGGRITVIQYDCSLIQFDILYN